MRRLLEELEPNLMICARDMFIETRRFTVRDSAELDCHESVNVLNLVEGDRCLVESVDGSFEPYEVHYAETFIVPECVGKYRLRAVSEKRRSLW